MSGTSGTIEWYLARDGQQHGPLTERELDKFIELGHLKPTDLLWRAGFDDWRQASDVFPTPPAKPVGDPFESADATVERRNAATESADEPSNADAARDHIGGENRTERDASRSDSSRSNADQGGRTGSSRQQSVSEDGAHAADGAHHKERQLDLGHGRHQEPGHYTPSRNDALRNDSAAIHPSALAGAVRPGRDFDREPTFSGPSAVTQRPEDAPRFSQFGQPGQIGAATGKDPATRAASTISSKPSPDALDDEDAFDDDEPEGRSGWLMVAAALFILVIVGAGGLFAYNNQKAIVAFYTDLAGKKTTSNQVAVIRAPDRAAREPAANTDRQRPLAPAAPAGNSSAQALSQTQSAPPTAAAMTPLPELPILKSKLWQFAQSEFGEWTAEREAEMRRLAAQAKSKQDANKYLIDAFVRFRRDNAAVALLASPDSLAQVAAAFVESLRALTVKGPRECYAFISNGESTPEVAALYFEPEIGTKLEAQMLAILKAIANGKSAPKNTRRPPSADDFSKLSSELGKRGWSAADMKLFSDPNELSKAKPEVVCRLVTEWFSTQTKLGDQVTRDQLIAASLRPVIGG